MTTSDTTAPRLILGPLLRYAGETAATIWVETDRACEVEILGHRAQTFEVVGHHYGLVVVDGLEPGTAREYQVTLDGTARWPEPDSSFPPSVLRTRNPARPLRILFGSCRVAELPAPRWDRERHEAEHGTDVLRAFTLNLPGTPAEQWPDVMLMIGDQVYADEVSPGTREFIRKRRDTSVPPGEEVADFTEYCELYREAWSEPSVRWLLSVLPTAMIFDDHDVHDDWNTSAAWRRDFRAKPWWHDRITGAYQSYWIYQHLGNLTPEDLAADETWRKIQAGGDATTLLHDLAVKADERPDGIRWSFRRTFGRTRVVVIDSRSGRVLDDGTRLMVDEHEWRWVTESVTGDFDHLVLASSLPVLLPPGIHSLEAWNEAVSAGAWGGWFAGIGEKVRRAADLEHWAAFHRSFTQFEQLLSGLAAGKYGEPPATITLLGGDIHHSYLAPVEFPDGTAAHSAVHQAVCSPIHNVLPNQFRRLQRAASSRAGALTGATLARLAGVPSPALHWALSEGPWFSNMLSQLEYDGRQGRITFERARPDPAGHPHLETVCATSLNS